MIIASILIPTFHRKKSLLILLENLTRQLASSVEVIVVEQGERNERELRLVAAKGKYSFHYIYLPRPSMTHARNVGAKAAKGEFLLFLDDDVIPQKGFIAHHLANFRDPRVAATTGRVTTKGGKIEAHHQRVGRVGILGQVSGGFSSAIHQEVDTVVGCNMCWRKDVYEHLGGVDERFTGNALREETDLSLRAKKAGYTIMFEPKAVVEHVRAESGGARKTEGRLQWYFDFFSNETYFFLKHMNKMFFPLFLLTRMNWILRCMFGFGREVSVRSIRTPWAGIVDGLKKYRISLHENRH